MRSPPRVAHPASDWFCHEHRVLQKFPLADDQIIAAGVIDDLTGFVDRDVPLADILPLLEQANVGGFVLPFANPRPQLAVS